MQIVNSNVPVSNVPVSDVPVSDVPVSDVPVQRGECTILNSHSISFCFF